MPFPPLQRVFPAVRTQPFRRAGPSEWSACKMYSISPLTRRIGIRLWYRFKHTGKYKGPLAYKPRSFFPFKICIFAVYRLFDRL